MTKKKETKTLSNQDYMELLEKSLEDNTIDYLLNNNTEDATIWSFEYEGDIDGLLLFEPNAESLGFPTIAFAIILGSIPEGMDNTLPSLLERNAQLFQAVISVTPPVTFEYEDGEDDTDDTSTSSSSTMTSSTGEEEFSPETGERVVLISTKMMAKDFQKDHFRSYMEHLQFQIRLFLPEYHAVDEHVH